MVEKAEMEENDEQEVELEGGDTEFEPIPSTPESKSGLQGSISGGSSSIRKKRDVFINFEILRASQHKVRANSMVTQHSICF